MEVGAVAKQYWPHVMRYQRGYISVAPLWCKDIAAMPCERGAAVDRHHDSSYTPLIRAEGKPSPSRYHTT